MDNFSQLILALAIMFNTPHSTNNTQPNKTQQESVKNTTTQSEQMKDKQMKDNTQTITMGVKK